MSNELAVFLALIGATLMAIDLFTEPGRAKERLIRLLAPLANALSRRFDQRMELRDKLRTAPTSSKFAILTIIVLQLFIVDFGALKSQVPSLVTGLLGYLLALPMRVIDASRAGESVERIALALGFLVLLLLIGMTMLRFLLAIYMYFLLVPVYLILDWARDAQNDLVFFKRLGFGIATLSAMVKLSDTILFVVQKAHAIVSVIHSFQTELILRSWPL